MAHADEEGSQLAAVHRRAAAGAVYDGFERTSEARHAARTNRATWERSPVQSATCCTRSRTSSSTHLKHARRRAMISSDCPTCGGNGCARKHWREVRWGRHRTCRAADEPPGDAMLLLPSGSGPPRGTAKLELEHPEKAIVARRIACDVLERLETILDPVLAILSLDADADAVAGRAAAFAPGDAGALEPVRGRVVLDEPSRIASGGYGGGSSHSTASRRPATRCSRRARAGSDPSADWNRGTSGAGGVSWRAGAVQRPLRACAT